MGESGVGSARGVSRSLFVFEIFCVFFFNDTATTEIYTLSLHDALSISSLILAFRKLNSLTFILYHCVLMVFRSPILDF